MKLKQSMNQWTLLSVAIAGIIGSGWLLGPLTCARVAGPAAILSWCVAGVLMMVVAATFVSLSKRMPTTGGTVRFFQLTYGHFAGFGFSWIIWLAWVAVPAIETMALLQYSSHYLPCIMTTGAHPVLTHLGLSLAVLCLLLMMILNCFGTKTFSKVNRVILLFKLIIPVLTAVMLLKHSMHTQNWVSAGGFMPYGIQSVFAALPMAGVIYSFIGFNPAIQMATETKRPERAIPIAVFGSLGVCILIYVLVQTAFILAVPSSSIARGWHAIQFAGSAAPFVGLLSLAGMVGLVKWLFVDATISPMGTALVQSMATSRMTLAMVENGYLPRCIAKLNSYHAPQRALILNFVVGVIFLMPFPSWQTMVGFLSSCMVLGYVVGPMSLMVLESDSSRQGQPVNWRSHVLSVCALTICSLMIYWSGWDVVRKMVLVFCIGYAVLGIICLSRPSIRKQLSYQQVVRGCWVWFYIFGLSVLSYCGSFGGQHWISFGVDFVWSAVLSVTTYVIAYVCVRKGGVVKLSVLAGV